MALDGNDFQNLRPAASLFKTAPSTLSDGDQDVDHIDANHGKLMGVPGSIPQSDWSLTNTAAANGQATASKAAGAAGIKHVCTGFSGQLVGDATGGADQAIINLRDGATGAGTILAQIRVSLAAGANAVGTPFALTGRWVGTAATAMTVEMSAAGALHTIGVVNATGHDSH